MWQNRSLMAITYIFMDILYASALYASGILVMEPA